MTRSALIRNVLLGVGVCTALGFGAASATTQTALPTGSSRLMCPPTKIYEQCVSCCFASGHTVEVWNGSTGQCNCSNVD